MTAIHADLPSPALYETQLLLLEMDEKFKKKHENITKQLDKRIKNLLNNQLLNRRMRLNNRIKEDQETAIELYGENIGRDFRLHYDQALEQELNETYNLIIQFLALLIKSKFSDEINLD